jgi:hypothetical protein
MRINQYWLCDQNSGVLASDSLYKLCMHHHTISVFAPMMAHVPLVKGLLAPFVIAPMADTDSPSGVSLAPLDSTQCMRHRLHDQPLSSYSR